MADEFQGQSAQFTDVLEVRVSDKQFDKGLQQLMSRYKEFVKEIEKEGGNASQAIGVGGVGLFAKSLETLQRSILLLRKDIREVFALGESSAVGATSATKDYTQATNAATSAVERLRNAQARKDNLAGNKAAEVQRERELAALRGDIGGRLTAQVQAEKAAAKEAERLAAATEKNKIHLGGAQGFAKGLFNNITQSLGQMIKFAVGFQVVFGILGAIAGLVKFIFFDSFKIGIGYLAEMQNRAVDIKETLIQNVKYSNDQAENFQKAGQAARAAAEEISIVSAKFGFAAEKIEAGLKGFIQGGGLSVMKGDLKESISLTAKLLSLYRSQGKNENNQLQFVRSITQLLNGTATGKDPLVVGLKQTPESIRKILDDVQKAGIKLSEHPAIVKSLQGTEDRLKNVNTQYENLIKSITAYGRIALGTFAQPVFEKILTVLQRVQSFLEKNQDKVRNIAALFGTVAEKVFDLGFGMSGLVTGILPKFLFLVAHSALEFAAIANSVRTIAGLGQNFTFGFGAEGKQKRANQDKILAEHDAEGDSLNELRKSLLELEKNGFNANLKDFTKTGTGFPGVLDFITNVLGGKHGEKPGKIARDLLGEVKDEFEEFFQSIRRTAEGDREATKNLVRNRVITEQQGSEAVIANIAREREQAFKLIDQYQRKIESIPNLDKRAKERAVHQLQLKRIDVQFDSIKATQEAQQESLEVEERYTDEHYQRLEQAAKAHADRMLEIQQQAHQAGTISDQEFFAAEIQAARGKSNATLVNLARERDKFKSGDPRRAAAEAGIVEESQNLGFTIRLLTEKYRLEQEILRIEEAQHQARLADASIDALRNEVELRATLKDTYHSELQDQLKIAHLVERRKKAALDLKQAELTRAQQNQPFNIKLLQQLQEEVVRLQNELAAAKNSRIGATANADPRVRVFGTTAINGDGEVSLKNAFSSFTNGLTSTAHALSFLKDAATNLISAFRQGKASGGILGGIGAVASNVASGLGQIGGSIGGSFGGALSKAAGFLGPIGGILSFAGGIFSGIAGLFTKAARKIGEEVARRVGDVMEKYARRQATLVDTIASLERERADAIRRLSGKKGGQDQLNKLLPQIDQQLTSLKNQQADIKERFEQNLVVMSQQGDIAQRWVKDWIEVNRQVKEYIDAVGQAAGAKYATEFLQKTLDQKRLDLQKELRDHESQAIEDALQFNQLLKDRTDLEKDYARQVAELNAQSNNGIERRVSGAVEAGRKRAELRAEFKERRDALDQEIKKATLKVDLERQLFNLSKDTTALKARELELSKIQLEEFKNTIWAIQNLLNQTNGLMARNGTFGGAALFSGQIPVPGFGATNAPAINVTVNYPPPNFDGRRLARDLYDEYDFRYRTRARYA